MAIRLLSVIGHSSKFSAVAGISALLGVPVTIYVATVLDPAEYGIYGLCSLWLVYAGLVGPGILSAGQREVPVLLGKGQEDEALRVQNISITAEMLYTALPVVAIIGASFLYSDPVVRLGLVMVAGIYVVTRLGRFWANMNIMREKFNIVAMGNAIPAILMPAVTLIGVNWLGVYALLLSPLIAHAVTWVYYLKNGPIGYRFAWDRTETIRLLRVGIFLQALTLAFWAFRLTDRTIIASTLPLEQLGLYTFAIGFAMYSRMLFANISRVLQPILWREAAEAASLLEGFRDIKRLTIYIALAAAVLIPVSQLAFHLVATQLTTKYLDSIPIFYALSYVVYFWAVGGMHGIILNSSLVNKQKILLYFYGVGLIFNVALDLLVIKMGYGVAGVAWVTVGTQGLVTLALYHPVRGYLFRDTREFLMFLPRIVVPLLASLPFYFVHTHSASIASNTWAFAGISLASQLVLWTLVIMILYRDYISMNEVRMAVNRIKMLIPGK